MLPELSAESADTVVLRDGTAVTIRSIRPDDAPRLQSLFGRLSRESIYFRFLELRKELSGVQARRLADLDHSTQVAMVATCGHSGTEDLIGVARYAVIPGSWPVEAEAAIVVEDQYQNNGLGSRLLERLAAHARANGVRVFLARVLCDNVRVLRLIRRSGLPVESRVEAGALALHVGIEPGLDRDSRSSRSMPEEGTLGYQEGRN